MATTFFRLTKLYSETSIFYQKEMEGILCYNHTSKLVEPKSVEVKLKLLRLLDWTSTV